MFFTDIQFRKLRELEKSMTDILSEETKEVLLGLDLVLTDSVYNTPLETNVDCPPGTLALMDVNHCCSYVDSTILREMSDYYGKLSTIVSYAENESKIPPMNKYRNTDILFSDIIFGENNKTFDEFINLFKPICFKDAIGGVHDEGLGWAPDGTYCGECSKVTCEGCTAIEDNK